MCSSTVTTPHCGTLSISLLLSIMYVYLAREERTRERDREIGIHPISNGSRDETNTTMSRREGSEVKRIEKERKEERNARVKQEEKRRVTDAGTEWPCSNTDHWPTSLRDWRDTDSRLEGARHNRLRDVRPFPPLFGDARLRSLPHRLRIGNIRKGILILQYVYTSARARARTLGANVYILL